MKERITAGIGIILGSIYLTFLQDVYVLNSKTECLFIMIHYCVIGLVLAWIKGHFSKKGSKYLKIGICVAAAVLLAVFQGNILPGERFIEQEAEIRISAVGENGSQPTREVWLTQFVADSKIVSLQNLAQDNNRNWIFKPEYGSYAFYPSAQEENHLIFHVSAKKVNMTFGQNSWSGMVEIKTSLGQNELLNLNSDVSGALTHVIDISAAVEREYRTWQIVLLNTGAFSALVFVSDFLLTALLYCLGKLKHMVGKK